MEHLNKENFKQKIFDFEAKKDWEYKGELPAILDFYADWCGPCKMVSPILEDLQQEYKGKINIYKINTDEESELAQHFGIRSIPSILFIPMNDKPQMTVGAMTKTGFVSSIRDILKVE
jgi:thioredoxin 1